MRALFSLSSHPPSGFSVVSTYERKQFRGRSFALYAESLSAAREFIAAEAGPLRGVLISPDEAELALSQLSTGLFHLRVDAALRPHLERVVQPLLAMLDEQLRVEDQIRAGKYEFERAMLHRERMADEFEAARASLLHELGERRAAEDRLSDANRKARALLDSAFGMLGILTIEGTLVEINRTSLEFADVALDDVTGRPFWHTPWWRHSPQAQAELEQAVARAARGEACRFETTHIDASDVVHDIDFALTPALDENGSVEFLITESWDISQRKQAERERERLQGQLMQALKLESIGRLAGGIAHDFNNMLAVIQGRVELALDETPPDSPTFADLEAIHGAAERSARLTGQLLAFARRQTLQPRILDLNKAVSGMLSMLERLLGEEIQLDWQPGSPLWTVTVDPSQLDQLLANLVVNARDAIKGFGTITITTRNVNSVSGKTDSLGRVACGDYVALSVRDSGAGISPEVREQIFEPFFTTKDIGEGTGLGLPMVLGIVEQHNGFIEVFSELGQGTQFVVHLPRTTEDQQVIRSSARPHQLPRGTERILIVEDEPALLRTQQRLLTRLGYQVHAVSSPSAALELLTTGAIGIDLLLTDIVMPTMTGRELALQVSRSHPEVKCLFMSGYAAGVLASEGDTSAISSHEDVIRKPFTSQELSLHLRRLLDAN